MQKKDMAFVFSDISQREGKKGMGNSTPNQTTLYRTLVQKDNAEPHLTPRKTPLSKYTHRRTFCAKKTVSICTKLLKTIN